MSRAPPLLFCYCCCFCKAHRQFLCLLRSFFAFVDGTCATASSVTTDLSRHSVEFTECCSTKASASVELCHHGTEDAGIADESRLVQASLQKPIMYASPLVSSPRGNSCCSSVTSGSSVTSELS